VTGPTGFRTEEKGKKTNQTTESKNLDMVSQKTVKEIDSQKQGWRLASTLVRKIGRKKGKN